MTEQSEQSLTIKRRPGWQFTVGGALLEIDSARWTPEQRVNGVTLRCVFPTPDDEKRAVTEAMAEGAGGAVVYIQVRNALSELDGKPIPYLEKELVWKALGPHGRQLAIELFQQAMQPDKEALAKARASFQLSL